jgi:hypothetical protein
MEAIIPIILLVLRIVAIFICSSRAKELNRSSNGWGFFGFISPILAMIWIYCLKPIIKWEEKN